MANIDSEVLDKYLVQVRRVAESREKGVEKEIRRLYKALIKDLNGFLGNEYVNYSDEDERLTYGILQLKGEYARFLEEVNKKVEGILPEVKAVVNELIDDTYEKCYNGMVEGVKKSVTAETLQNEFKAVKAVRPEVIKAAVENPIPKLRLTPTLERCRKNVISNIKREIGVGLSQGDRISTMAKRINNRVDISYRQSMLIARTEAHRVRETGLNDAANEVDEVLKAYGSEYRKIKIWNTSGDKAVRDTHAKMNGVAVLQDEKFELPSGATADCPGTSGVASEDCNCRCFLTHDIVTDSEFYQLTGRHFPDYEKNISKMAANNSGGVDWSGTTATAYSDAEKQEMIDYAESKNIGVKSMNEFDGDRALFTEQVDTLRATLDEFGIKRDVSINFSKTMSDDDFASTDTNKGVITFNTKALRDRKITNSILNADNFLASSDITGIAAHEAGHLMPRKVREKSLDIAKQAYYNIYGEDISTEGIIEYLRKNVSIYSVAVSSKGNWQINNTKNYKEIISELIAKNKTNPTRYSHEFVRLLKE